MGAQQEGVRVTALVPDKLGELDVLTHAIAEDGGEFVSLTQFAGESALTCIVMFKVRGLDEGQVLAKIKPYIEKLIDIRTCCP